MKLGQKANKVHAQISGQDTKLGDLRKIAKEIKKDHQLAMELWSTGAFFSRQLAILIMDKKLLTQNVIDQLDADMQAHDDEERNQLIDWLMANQLSKDKKTVAMMESWADSPSALQRRVFWYYQARLRWMGKTDQSNTNELLDAIEAKILDEPPEVQWAMNYTAGQIGKFQPRLRSRCMGIGEQTGLYKDEVVARGCTPNYLPEFIKMEVAKLSAQ
ncbi:MAG: DNA alkylation repair protein [Acidimicrobiales bacterium]|nr:DNA alkylation repair protein [Hyphomonadaceae bacterium]RZV40754.1 MAG: DNA alkylation repair protein [Acidimicrobiales bacterium]